MKIIRRHDDGSLRCAGIPLGSFRGPNTESKLRSFEPENPHIFIPRRFGIGWDLNLGALAVRLGFIRPDDSLPDLAPYIPQKIYAAARITPWVNTLLINACAWKLAHKSQVVKSWRLNGKPRRQSSGTTMALETLGANSALLWYAYSSAPANSSSSDSYPELVSGSEVIALQIALILTALSSYRSSLTPSRRRLSPALGLVCAPLLSTALCVGIVKIALHNLEMELRSEDNAHLHE